MINLKCVSVDDICDSIIQALDDKIPRVKEFTLNWLKMIFSQKLNSENANCVQKLSRKCCALFEDGSINVRLRAFELFAVFLFYQNDEFVKKTFQNLKTVNLRAYFFLLYLN